MIANYTSIEFGHRICLNFVEIIWGNPGLFILKMYVIDAVLLTSNTVSKSSSCFRSLDKGILVRLLLRRIQSGTRADCRKL